MKKLSFIDRKIPVKFLFILFPIMILQLLLPVRKIALFLIDDLNIPFELLLITENLTASISVLILCLFLIQKLNRNWLSKKAFSIGFLIFFLPILFFILFEFTYLPVPYLIEIIYEGIEIIYKGIEAIFLPFVYFIKNIYQGWGWAVMDVYGYFVFFVYFVIFPTIGGILSSLIYGLYKKIKQ